MRIVIALLYGISMLAPSAQANAEAVFVGKVPSVGHWPSGDAILEFRHDAALRNAWVSATLCEKYIPGDWENSDCRPYNSYKFKVPGLIYDGRSGEIRLGGRVCATVDNGWLGSTARQTGQCGLKIGTIDQVYDGPFERHWRPMDVITIQLK